MPKRPFILALWLVLIPAGIPAAKAQQPAVSPVIQDLIKADQLRRQGKDAEARKVYESMLPGLREQGPSPELGTVLLSLSDLAMASGDYDQVIELGRDSLAVYAKCDNKEGLAQEGQALAHNSIGVAQMNAGRYADAAGEIETALQLFLTNARSRPDDIVSTYNNLGNVYYYQARYTEALRSYESAQREVEKRASEPWAPSWRQRTLFNLATLYQRLGNYQRALDSYKGIERSAQGLAPAELAHLYTNMGALLRRLGDGYKALDTYGKAEQLYTRQKDADGELGVKKNIGIVLAFELDRKREALNKFDEVRALAEKSGNRREAMQALLYRGKTLYDMGRIAEAEKEFTAALAAAAQLGTVEEQWSALYDLGLIAATRGNSAQAEARFRESIGRIEGLRSKLQLSFLKSDFLVNKRDVYDALIKLLLDRNDAAGAFEFMERSRARAFQDRYFSEANAPAMTLRSAQEHLPGNAALIEFWAGQDAVAAVWATKNASGIAQTQLSADARNDMVRFISSLPDDLGMDWQGGFRKLTALLPQGVRPFAGKDYPHLMIVPDGILSLVPFELLDTPSGKILLEEHDITYLPTAALLTRARFAQQARLRFPWQRQLLAFGDPAVIGHGESPLVAGMREEISGNLPYSGEEVRAIAHMSDGRTKLFLGPDDRKQFLFSASRASLLHVSTHAVADLDNPERSRLLFSPDAAGQRNNYVFLKELYDLDLRGVSLATLSACDTERGHLLPGEGIQAFSRALLAAGSKSSLTTLWRVPDQPTAEFMKQFYYFLLVKHRPKAEALRLAKLKFLRSGTVLSHPSYWAAFVLNGDGSEPVPRFVPWYVLVSPAVLLIIGAWWLIRRRKSA